MRSSLGPRGFAFLQAPFSQRRAPSGQAPASHAEMLALEGYADQASLWGIVRGWLSLAKMFRLETILADHSPGALTAGRILGLPQAQLGHGFEIPPRLSPLPSIRPWENVPPERLKRAEERLVTAVNGTLRSFRGRELERLADLFDTEARVLATFPDLDPFGPRPGEQYVGPIYDASSGDSAVWPGAGGPRIYAYLRPNVDGVGDLLRGLKETRGATLCFCPGLGPASIKDLASDRLRITTRPLRLDSVLPEADLAVLYGGHGVLSAALAMGVPVLASPQNVEQYLHAKRAESLGACALVSKDPSAATVASQLTQAVASDALRSAAKAFAARHDGFDPARATEEAARIIDTLAGRRREVPLTPALSP